VRHGIRVQKRRVALDDLQADTGCALDERIRAQQHCRADIGRRKARPGSVLRRTCSPRETALISAIVSPVPLIVTVMCKLLGVARWTPSE
jgi:hypothetical protein